MHCKIHIQNSTDQKHIFGNNIFEKHKNKKMFYISLPTCQNVIHFGKFRSEIKIFVQSLVRIPKFERKKSEKFLKVF